MTHVSKKKALKINIIQYHNIIVADEWILGEKLQNVALEVNILFALLTALFLIMFLYN